MAFQIFGSGERFGRHSQGTAQQSQFTLILAIRAVVGRVMQLAQRVSMSSVASSAKKILLVTSSRTFYAVVGQLPGEIESGTRGR